MSTREILHVNSLTMTINCPFLAPSPPPLFVKFIGQLRNGGTYFHSQSNDPLHDPQAVAIESCFLLFLLLLVGTGRCRPQFFFFSTFMTLMSHSLLSDWLTTPGGPTIHTLITCK